MQVNKCTVYIVHCTPRGHICVRHQLILHTEIGKLNTLRTLACSIVCDNQPNHNATIGNITFRINAVLDNVINHDLDGATSIGSDEWFIKADPQSHIACRPHTALYGMVLKFGILL